jgi:general secretion pathway protein C
MQFLTTAREQLTSGNALKFWRWLIGIILVVMIAQSAASFTWKVVGLGFGPLAQSPAGAVNGRKPQPVAKVAVSSRNAAPLEELSLFGQSGRVERSGATAPLASEAAPETTLELVLKGVITAEPKSRALAIVAEKGKANDEQLYGIGDKVPGNAIISEILADRLILRRGGVLETLMLQDQGLADLAVNRAAESVALNGDDIVNLGDGVHWEIDNAYLNQRLNDIPSLAREVGVEVYKEDNVQKGYRLVSARGSKLLRDMGLQPGDVLHEVNGVPLDTIQAGLSVYQQMRNAQQIRVVISRNGRRETRIYEINNDG